VATRLIIPPPPHRHSLAEQLIGACSERVGGVDDAALLNDTLYSLGGQSRIVVRVTHRGAVNR
jgi:hypothetical protein